MTEERIWQIYNFVNDWKNGKYGIMDIEICFNHYIGSEPIDEEKLNDLALTEYPEDDDEFEPLFNITQHNLREVFKAGYRAAKNE